MISKELRKTELENRLELLRARNHDGHNNKIIAKTVRKLRNF